MALASLECAYALKWKYFLLSAESHASVQTFHNSLSFGRDKLKKNILDCVSTVYLLILRSFFTYLYFFGDA